MSNINKELVLSKMDCNCNYIAHKIEEIQSIHFRYSTGTQFPDEYKQGMAHIKAIRNELKELEDLLYQLSLLDEVDKK